MTGRTAKGEDTRSSILQAATEVFARRGYAGTRMEDVFEAVGLTKGAVYFYFPSKEKLARAVVEHHKQRWLALGQEEVARHDDPLTQFRRLANLLITLSASDAAGWSIVRLADQLPATSDESESVAGNPMTEWIDLMADIIRRGQGVGVFAKIHAPADLGFIAVAAFDGLKTTTDAVAPGDSDEFRRRAEILVGALESALIG
ncbi:TetR family transcriptional regulator [Microbacterium sp. ZW T5_45]|uniref:TetR family transcriptional regulator n=1 Tax=Microbacterium sp. ZW T5_45 TaxID=3378080 RepID=UPI003851FBC6